LADLVRASEILKYYFDSSTNLKNEVLRNEAKAKAFEGSFKEDLKVLGSVETTQQILSLALEDIMMDILR
jgi:hypothetical protein